MIIRPDQQLNDCRDFVDAGLCVIPLRLDGSKASFVPWKQYQDRKPTDAELDDWFAGPAGVAVVCGAVSGGLEVLDFDSEAQTVFPAWSALVDSVLCWLPVVETPSGGYHVYYRCPSICGNQKIAMADNHVLIESRGQGGYVATIMNPPDVHANHYEYIQVGGPLLPDVPTITPDERKALWKAALSFDRSGILKSRQVAMKPSPRTFFSRVHYGHSSNRLESARKYVGMMEPAISGQNGHNQTYKVACKLTQKFGLPQPPRCSHFANRAVIVDSMTDVTRILNQIEAGDPTAASQLLPLVYEDLKQLAAKKMVNERPGQTLQATALVHDAYLRLVGSNGSPNWSSRGHFFAAAAKSMRRILIENARKKQRIRHGGGRKRVDLNVVNVADPQNYDFLDALDQAIDDLAEENPTAAQVVNLRFFAGLTIEQTAESLNVSVRTANRHWAYAKAWIYQQISGEEDISGRP